MDSRPANNIVVMMVMLGLGSEVAIGRKSQYIKMCPGLNKQNIRSEIGVGSQTAISQTSLVASGCDRASALSRASMFDKKRKGDEAIGEESIRTR